MATAPRNPIIKGIDPTTPLRVRTRLYRSSISTMSWTSSCFLYRPLVQAVL